MPGAYSRIEEVKQNDIILKLQKSDADRTKVHTGKQKDIILKFQK